MNFTQRIVNKKVPVHQVFKETFEHTVFHFNVKRIQQSKFFDDLQERIIVLLKHILLRLVNASNKKRQWVHSGVEKVETYSPVICTTREKQGQCFTLLTTKKIPSVINLLPFCYHDAVKFVRGNFEGYYIFITEAGENFKNL